MKNIPKALQPKSKERQRGHREEGAAERHAVVKWHTAHAQGSAARGKEQGGRRHRGSTQWVSYTSAFASWRTGRGALQQRENTTLHIFTGKEPGPPYQHTHTDLCTSHFLIHSSTHISRKNCRIKTVRRQLLRCSLRLMRFSLAHALWPTWQHSIRKWTISTTDLFSFVCHKILIWALVAPPTNHPCNI